MPAGACRPAPHADAAVLVGREELARRGQGDGLDRTGGRHGVEGLDLADGHQIEDRDLRIRGRVEEGGGGRDGERRCGGGGAKWLQRSEAEVEGRRGCRIEVTGDGDAGLEGRERGEGDDGGGIVKYDGGGGVR